MANFLKDIFYFEDYIPFKKVSSLQKLCLTVVVLNFSLYVDNYKSADSQVPKMFFEFLQKKYSSKILKKLVQFSNMKLDFLDVIFTKYLKEVKLGPLNSPQCSIEKILEKILQIGEELRRLSLVGTYKSKTIQSALSQLPNLRKLEIEVFGDDSAMEVIANNCPLLIELNVNGSNVTDKGMNYLCFPKSHKLQLEYIDISFTLVEDEGVLLVLKYIPTLNVIKALHKNLANVIADGAAKEDFSNTEFLNLINMEVRNPQTELQPIVKLCPNMKYLLVENMNSVEQLQSCYAFRKLEKVRFSYESHKSNVCINNFLKSCGFSIRNLSLKNFSMSGDVLASSCPNLTVLELCDMFSEEPPNKKTSSLKFEKLTHFKIKCLSEGTMSPVFIIKSSPNLESIFLHDSSIDSNIGKAILDCPATLLQLNFHSTTVKINFLKQVLVVHKMLRFLYIDGYCSIFQDDFKKLLCVKDILSHPVYICFNEL